MIKPIIVSVFLSFTFICSSYAQDGDRMSQLEKEIQELKLRVLKLESLLNEPNKARPVDTSSEGWRYVANWRKLSTDMSSTDVQKILGEPDRINGGSVEFWYYQNGGTVTYISGKVHSWSEPKK